MLAEGLKKKKSRRGFGLLPLIIGVLLFAFLILYSEKMSEIVYDSFVSTGTKVLPVLFPFMICSKFLVNSGAIKYLENSIGRMLSGLLGLPKEATSGIILGSISSFPIGAMTVLSQYEAGNLSSKEAERAVFLAHNTGPSFPVGIVGIKYWNSGLFGVLIYFAQILSGFIIGLTLRPHHIKNLKNKSKLSLAGENKNISASLTEAISSSSLTAVSVVGFIVFWESMIGLICMTVGHDLELVKCILSSFLEFSTGALNASSLGGVKGAAFCGFSIGFSGVSALMQVSLLAFNLKLSVKKLILLKFFQGILTAVFVIIAYLCLFG